MKICKMLVCVSASAMTVGHRSLCCCVLILYGPYLASAFSQAFAKEGKVRHILFKASTYNMLIKKKCKILKRSYRLISRDLAKQRASTVGDHNFK